MIRYELPYPPSVNGLFFNATKGRVKTDAYKAWRRDAGNLILVQGRKHMRGPVSLSIAIVRPDKRKRDLSNTIKAIEDLLVEMQIIDDDSLVQRISIAWVGSGSPCVVLIQQAEEAITA
jgi:Holliday junction resolvase RusA-like endonuclease